MRKSFPKPNAFFLFFIFFTVGILSFSCHRANFEKGEKAFEKKDYETSLKNFEPLAQKGDPRALYYLGLHYANGYEVEKNLTQAVQLFRQSAEKNHAKGQYQLAVHLLTGGGTQQNITEAYKWFLLSEKNGFYRAKIFTVGLKEKLTKEQIAQAQKSAQNWQDRHKS